jgi:hypothetical protein
LLYSLPGLDLDLLYLCLLNSWNYRRDLPCLAWARGLEG